MTAGYSIRGNALQIPMADESVDLIITSPPYFALRSYRDGDEHYAHQIGSEPTPREFLEALWAAMAECWRVLKPEGSCWINLGDKYAGSGGHNNSALAQLHQNHGRPSTDRHAKADESWKATRRNAPDSYNKAADVRAKSLMGLPWSFATGCIGAFPFEPGLAAPDGQTWILRAEVVWDKPNGLPESVTDRVRRSHEQWFHFTKSPRCFSAIDEIREPSVSANRPQETKNGKDHRIEDGSRSAEMKSLTELHLNPLGRPPGSVWTVPSEPLMVPDWARERWNLPDHFAAFPQEFPRRIILGWSPSGICQKCGEGRRPVVEKALRATGNATGRVKARDGAEPDGNARGWNAEGYTLGATEATITGYACACTPRADNVSGPGDGSKPHKAAQRVNSYDWQAWKNREPKPCEYDLTNWTPAPTRPAVILDPFGGTGTVAMVAKALGRIGMSLDLSADYCRLADWRINHSNHAKKSEARTWAERQGVLA